MVSVNRPELVLPSAIWQSCGRLLVVAGLALGLPGCASLPDVHDKTVSLQLPDYQSTRLGGMAAAVLPEDGRSGFRLLQLASAAYQTRIELIAAAQRTLDVQYYLFQSDRTGKFFMMALRDAARRGVRVRILIDDLYTAGEDTLLDGLAAYPNVELRVFNPFANGRGSDFTRLLFAWDQLGRVDHRMHNKMFIADNAAAVVGGRNMADEYFMRADSNNFVDLDLFAIGPVVRGLSSEFDHYWNSDYVYPIDSLVHSRLSSALRQQRFAELTESTRAPIDEVVEPDLRWLTTLPEQIVAGKLGDLVFANATAVADPVQKAAGAMDDAIAGTVTEHVLSLLATAKSDVIMASPYFVPGERGMENIRKARAQGVHLLVITNSLAATDELAAQLGYIRYRRQMLEAGVDIRELSPTLVTKRRRFGPFGFSRGALHTKMAVVDRRWMFIGSMNLDRRSAYRNTEDGIIIDSPELATQLLWRLDSGASYTLRLNPVSHNIEWVEHDGDKEIAYPDEPEVGFWRWLQMELFDSWIPEKEL